ncbi:MAG TPA: PSD1 and planctomycete cytochrome C domain-containing protein [Pirellulales bacterium]|nr:PSD1 and planctomycete cytochrome C domain-containing protein [Pirellulales bacterium]
MRDLSYRPSRAARPWRLIALCLTLLSSPASADEVFDRQVHPILAGKCFRCHGGERVSGSLRVDSRDGLVKGGDSGPAIVPGKADESLLMRAVRRVDDVSAMPPDKPLRPDEIASLAAWVEAGALWPERAAAFKVTRHWAFEPLGHVAVPAVKAEEWPRNSIDRFILGAEESAGVHPSPEASRRTLLRRASYDLTGLPPTPDEVEAFEADGSPDAWEGAVDRLLSSPRYGEHWGRHWLDVVRYADTAGENSDHPLPHAWRYRNWVIQAFNEDKPYDEFVREQIAGDLLAADGPTDQYAGRIVATGYLAIARRFGHDIDQDMHLTYEDTIDTFGKSLLGLSLGCCRCHDHKYDPLSTRDYYGLYGVFDSTRFPFPGCEPKQQPGQMSPLLTPEEIERQVKPWQQQLAAADAEIEAAIRRQADLSRQTREAAAKSARVLAAGEIDDGKAAALPAQVGLEGIAVKQGDVIQLSVLPRGNHGADSTLVELEINEIVATTAEAPGRRWKTNDLVDDLTTENPHPDRYGNAATWCFLDGLDGPSFLAETLSAIDGKAELKCWRNGDTPSVFVNTSGQPVKVWTELPPRAFFVHPGPQGPVGLAWISPVDGLVAVSGRLADAHPGGSDGVAWTLEHVSSADAGTSLRLLGEVGKERRLLKQRRDELAARQPAVPVAYAVTEAAPHDARIQRRGEPNDLGDEVPRKFIDILGGQHVLATGGSGRRELAEWVTSAKNPLAARVMVNRIWQWHFGRGLVATPNDFGIRGSAPTHPELLDHLASVFIDGGYRIKAMHRLIMHSATYRQASSDGETGPWYASFPRRRLAAEELRDTLLAVSDDLDPAPGAGHPFPPEATWNFTQHAPFAAEYQTAKRSVYLMQKRNRRSRFFALFDGADPNASTPVRDVTTVPTQALFFLNDPFLHRCSERLAERLMASSPDDGQRIDFACRLLFGRPGAEADRLDALEFLSAYQSSTALPPGSNRHAAAWAAYARVLLSSNEMLHVD